MRTIFQATDLSGISLRNRLVRSATWEGLADDKGYVSDELVEIYEKLGAGGVGLVISSYLYVRMEGRQQPDQIGVYHDSQIPGLARLADAVHRYGGSIVGQIVHCGGQAKASDDPVAPSAVSSPGYPQTPRALEPHEIGEIIGAFALGAERLEKAGFDGVQLHGAHGYLLAQFLSPSRNRRDDAYGGTVENRSRFAREVVAAVRDQVSPSFPVMIKLNANDFLEGSTTEEDAVHLARALAAAGIAAIEVSGGTGGSGPLLGAARPDIEKREDEAYFLPQARILREAVPEVPLMLVGGIRSLEVMEEILLEGTADYFSMSRPLIREPDLPLRWQRGDRDKARCISCLGCFGPAQRGEGIRCIQDDP